MKPHINFDCGTTGFNKTRMMKKSLKSNMPLKKGIDIITDEENICTKNTKSEGKFLSKIYISKLFHYF